jgi:hypothetical protein
MTAPVKKSVHPTTFDELLDACPELRYVRYLSMQDLQTLLGRAVDECAWCGTQIPDWKPGRKTCKRECSEHLKERCCDRTKKQLARERDQGLCQICGRDTGLAQRAAERAWEERTGTKCATDSQERSDAEKAFFRLFGWSRNWSEVDHIVPVIEGGGLCTIDNLRLLCGQCHRNEDTKLRVRSCIQQGRPLHPPIVVRTPKLPAWITKNLGPQDWIQG